MRLVAILGLLALLAGTAQAADPIWISGPAGDGWQAPLREDVCQWGFQDDLIGGGFALQAGQPLGIRCVGPMTITRVGFYVEFIVTPGQVDIVILDGEVEVQRTQTTPAVGDNEFDIPDIAVADPTIMLCPVGAFDGATGEDITSFGNSYYSTTCAPTSPFEWLNLMIWAVYTDEPVPAPAVSWGTIRALYR
ncbi:MAG: hypothetical protein ACE15D_18530 [Candidatus Eisenbacteria bacterium]|nr:hypothetical protein [Candidatus Eisenbacteria bacterium]